MIASELTSLLSHRFAVPLMKPTSEFFLQGRITRRPSFEGAAARLNDYCLLSVYQCSRVSDIYTNVVTLFPSPSSSESETYPCRGGASLEKEY